MQRKEPLCRHTIVVLWHRDGTADKIVPLRAMLGSCASPPSLDICLVLPNAVQKT